MGERVYTPRWLKFPPTPSLPPAIKEGTVPVSGDAKIWYSLFGNPLDETLAAGKPPVLFLHGSLTNANYFGHQISELQDLETTLLALDTRGHGRSTQGSRPLGYDEFAHDVISVLDHLNIPKVALVGWCDGAMTGYSIAMNHPSRLERLFSFAGYSDPSSVNPALWSSPMAQEYFGRTDAEYKGLNPEPDEGFMGKIQALLSSQPNWTEASFASIPTLYNDPKAPLIWVVSADHDEVVLFEPLKRVADWIPGSAFVTLPEVSNFAFLQDPKTFTLMIRLFLARDTTTS